MDHVLCVLATSCEKDRGELSLANEAQYLLIGSASVDALLVSIQQRHQQTNISDDLLSERLSQLFF